MSMPTQLSCTLELEAGQRAFGLKFNGARDAAEKQRYGGGVYVAGFEPGSVADRHPCIRAGWQVTKVNTFDLTNGTMADLRTAVQNLRNGKMYLESKQNPQLFQTYATIRLQAQQTYDPNHPTTMIELVKDIDPNSHFGLKFGGVRNQTEVSEKGRAGMLLLGVKPGSVADRSTDIHLAENLQIININGVDLKGLTLEQVVPVFREFGDTISMVLREDSGLEALQGKLGHVMTDWEDANPIDVEDADM